MEIADRLKEWATRMGYSTKQGDLAEIIAEISNSKIDAISAEPDYSNTYSMFDIEENARKLAVAWGDNMRDDFINQKVKLASDIMNYAKWYAAKKPPIKQKE